MNSPNTFFCERLRRLRNTKSQAEIARLCGIPQSSYTRYEAGTVTPKHDALSRIATHYRMTVEQLMHGEHNHTEQTLSASEIAEASNNFKARTAPLYPAGPFPKSPDRCCACAEKDTEIAWLRDTITRLQENFRAALAAAEKKEKL